MQDLRRKLSLHHSGWRMPLPFTRYPTIIVDQPFQPMYRFRACHHMPRICMLQCCQLRLQLFNHLPPLRQSIFMLSTGITFLLTKYESHASKIISPPKAVLSNDTISKKSSVPG
jgi:hypothetical protein